MQRAVTFLNNLARLYRPSATEIIENRSPFLAVKVKNHTYTTELTNMEEQKMRAKIANMDKYEAEIATLYWDFVNGRGKYTEQMELEDEVYRIKQLKEKERKRAEETN